MLEHPTTLILSGVSAMKLYCTYITFYKGNKLPPFYIGSTLIHKISKGYKGSVRSSRFRKIWEEELKTNPSLFKTIILSTHEDHGDALEKEAKFQKALNVINNPLYINMGIAKRGFGNLSLESRKIISEKAKMRDYSFLKGENHFYFGGRPEIKGDKNPSAKRCLVLGKEFGCVKHAAEFFNIPYMRCYKMVRYQKDGCKFI